MLIARSNSLSRKPGPLWPWGWPWSDQIQIPPVPVPGSDSGAKCGLDLES